MRGFAERAGIWVLVLALLVLAFWWSTSTGFRFDQVIPDPLAGFTKHQWGALLSGFTGAGLSAVIAYLAFKRTLDQQRRQFSTQARADEDRLEQQLAAQREQLDQQLLAQEESMRQQLAATNAQITANAREAAKERELAARAELLSAVLELHEYRAGFQAISEAGRRYRTSIEKWRFELVAEEDQELQNELAMWRGVLPAMAFTIFESERQGKGSQGLNEFEKATYEFEQAVIRAARPVFTAEDRRGWTTQQIAVRLRQVRDEVYPIG